MDKVEALKAIIKKSPQAAKNAAKALSSLYVCSSLASAQCSIAAIQALEKPDTFTEEERAAIGEMIVGEKDNKVFLLRVRLSHSDRLKLAEKAEKEGFTISEYVRRRIL